VTRSQLFGAAIFPGRFATDTYQLSLDRLRREAAASIQAIGYTPAQVCTLRYEDRENVRPIGVVNKGEEDLVPSGQASVRLVFRVVRAELRRNTGGVTCRRSFHPNGELRRRRAISGAVG
jgi:hypothetical protein